VTAVGVVLGFLVGVFAGWAVVAHSSAPQGGETMVIKVLYCVFLAALVVLFVGWAETALYPTPQWDIEYPGIEEYESGPQEPSALKLEGLTPAERRAQLQQYEAERKEYEVREAKRARLRTALSKKVDIHDRNVSLISLLVAVAVMALSVGLSAKLPVISEGLLLGGLFTLIYSIGWSFVRSPKIAVIPVGVGLIVTIALGYKRFVRPLKG
jgi:hypothetical protein